VTPAPEMAPRLAASSPEQEAPVGNDGGLSINAQYGAEVASELVAEYHNNVNLTVTPECWVTSVPLLIHPESPSQAGYSRPDDNHHPEHPRLHSRLADDAGLAVRHSRVIRMNHWVHHNAVHSTFRGPELPTSIEDKFIRVIFNAAGYIPGHAIYLQRPGEYSVRPLAESIREKLWKNKAVHVERSGIVTNFLKTYLIDWSLENTGQKDIDALLIARDPVDRWK